MVWHQGHQPGSLAFLLLEWFVRRCSASWIILSLQHLVPRSQFHPINCLIPSLYLLLSYPVHLLQFCFRAVLSLSLPLCFPWRIPQKSSSAASQTLLGFRLEGVGQSFTLKHRCGASKLLGKEISASSFSHIVKLSSIGDKPRLLFTSNFATHGEGDRV